MNPIYDTLNERQLEAVMHTEGPLSVTAGAGSGKTKVLTAVLPACWKSGRIRIVFWP